MNSSSSSSSSSSDNDSYKKALGASALHSAGRSWTQTPVSKLPDFIDR